MARKSKQKRKGGSQRKAGVGKAPPQISDAPTDPGRRAGLSTLGLYAMGAVVIGGGGTAFAYDFMKSLGEQDLSKIGQGTPAVVQIHDPQCALCRSLQVETRKALRAFGGSEITYLVANIRNTEGAAFASRAGLGHVTLALFDGSGTMVHTIHGVTPASTLEAEFRRHLGVPLGS